MLITASSQSLAMMILGTALTGLFSVVAQILVPLAATLASPDKRGKVVGTIMSGLLLGIDPKIAKLFDTNGDGKADLTGCNPGWGCEGAINHQLAAYELTNTVTHNQGNYAAMMADTISRYKEGKPVFYYTWTPYWVSNELKPGKDVVWLQVPFSALPGDKNADTKLPNGANYGFPVSTMHIVANKAWAEKNPAAAKLFAIMQLPVADINAQNAIMHDGKASEGDIQGHVDGWIKAHQQQFDGWVNEALAAQK